MCASCRNWCWILRNICYDFLMCSFNYSKLRNTHFFLMKKGTWTNKTHFFSFLRRWKKIITNIQHQFRYLMTIRNDMIHTFVSIWIWKGEFKWPCSNLWSELLEKYIFLHAFHIFWKSIWNLNKGQLNSEWIYEDIHFPK